MNEKRYKDSIDLYIESKRDSLTPDEYSIFKQKTRTVLDFYYKDIKDKAQSLDWFEIAVGDIFRISMRHQRIYSSIKTNIKKIRDLETDLTPDKKEERFLLYNNLKKLLILRNLSSLQRKYKIVNLKAMMKRGYVIKHINWFKDINESEN